MSQPKLWHLSAACILSFSFAQSAQANIDTIKINRNWEVLRPVSQSANSEHYRSLIRQAGQLLGDWEINIAGLTINGAYLIRLAGDQPKEPFLRLVRETMGRPIDLRDFCFFLDDLLVAGFVGARKQTIWVPSGRARDAGITIHPDDVFKKNKARLYASNHNTLTIYAPKRPQNVARARDWDVLGPDWAARYKNLSTHQKMIIALNKHNKAGDFGQRIEHLGQQIRSQGGQYHLHSTVRNRVRGYLMWGAYLLSKQKSRNTLRAKLRKLNRHNRRWGLNVPIRWKHPKGWNATISAATEMAETYDVVYATQNGAESSNHYSGQAADFSAFALPRSLSLEAPNGVRRVFDLSNPQETRDLSLSPDLIAWVEKNYGLKKLKEDYPHWDDPLTPTTTD
jgi:hypothetical protein